VSICSRDNDLPVPLVQELIEYARRTRQAVERLSGNGTTGTWAASCSRRLTGIDMVHVPYKGSAQAINDLISGFQVMFDK